MRLVMFLLSLCAGYLSWLMVDGFLLCMSIITLFLAFTVKHWTGRDG